MSTLTISAPAAMAETSAEGAPAPASAVASDKPTRKRRAAIKSPVPTWLRLHSSIGKGPSETASVHGLKFATVHELGLLFMSTLGEIFLTAKDSESFYKLTGAQKKIILFLALHGAQRMGEVAHLISSSMPAASAVIDRLEALGLVDRKRDNVDRRVVMVELTESGFKAHEEMARVREERLSVLFRSMPEAQRQEFVNGLNRIHEIVQATAAAAEAAGGR